MTAPSEAGPCPLAQARRRASAPLLDREAGQEKRPPWLEAASCSGGVFRMLFKEEVEDVSSTLLLARSVPSRDSPVRSRSRPAGAGPAQGSGAPAGWLLNARGSLFLDIARFLDRRCPRCAGLRLLRTEEAEDAGLRQRRPPGKRRPPLWDCLMLAGIRRSPPRGRVQSCLQEFREVLRTLRQTMRAVPAPVPVLTLQEPCQPFPQRPVHVAGDRPPDPAAWQGGEAEHV